MLIWVRPEEFPPWFALGMPTAFPALVPKSRGRVASLNRLNPTRTSLSNAGLKIWFQSKAKPCTLLSNVEEVPEPSPPSTLGKFDGVVALGVGIAQWAK